MKPPTNLDQVFETFEKNYKPIPLEIYGNDPYKTLIATLLSARTKDTLTVKVCEEKLFKKASVSHLVRQNKYSDSKAQ